MALTNCRDCGAVVSGDAKTCLKCGAPTPDRFAYWMKVAGAWLIVALVVVGYLGSQGYLADGGTKLPSPVVSGAHQDGDEYVVHMSNWGGPGNVEIRVTFDPGEVRRNSFGHVEMLPMVTRRHRLEANETREVRVPIPESLRGQNGVKVQVHAEAVKN